MVRLVVLSLLLALAGCAPSPLRQLQEPAGADDLPDWQAGTLTALDEGQHHPAVASLLRQAEQARQQRRWDRVHTYLDQARQIQPRNPAIFYRQAWVRLQQNEPQQAEHLLRRALVFAGEDAALKRRLYALLAEALDAQGRPAEANAARQQSY